MNLEKWRGSSLWGWPFGRLEYVPVGVAPIDVGRIVLVGVQSRVISSRVVDKTLAYL